MGKFKTITLASLLLLGCSSFNHTEYHITLPVDPELLHGRPPVPIEESLTVLPHEHETEQKTVKEAILLCPKAVFPKLPPPPELPLKALARVKPNDQLAIDRIVQDHIEAQHRYIVNSNKIIAEATKKYELECSRYLRKGK